MWWSPCTDHDLPRAQRGLIAGHAASFRRLDDRGQLFRAVPRCLMSDTQAVGRLVLGIQCTQSFWAEACRLRLQSFASISSALSFASLKYPSLLPPNMPAVRKDVKLIQSSLPYPVIGPDSKKEVKDVKGGKGAKRDVYVYDKPFFLSLVLKVSIVRSGLELLRYSETVYHCKDRPDQQQASPDWDSIASAMNNKTRSSTSAITAIAAICT